MVQLSHPYMTTGKTIALTRWIFASKVISLLFNKMSRFVMAFLPRRKHSENSKREIKHTGCHTDLYCCRNLVKRHKCKSVAFYLEAL